MESHSLLMSIVRGPSSRHQGLERGRLERDVGLAVVRADRPVSAAIF
ncbi:MAG: hypothetical protein ACT4NY_10825 [Pseudonocardiales bacterium]